MHTRGHANHHFCVEVSESSGEKVVFTGDAFGLVYPDLQKKGLFVFASTSPTDFDGEAAKASVQRIVALGAAAAYPTHFGAVQDIQAAAQQLTEFIDFSQKLMEEAQNSKLPDEKLSDFCEGRIKAKMSELLASHDLELSGDVADLLKMDIELNAQGLASVAKKLRAEFNSRWDRYKD